MTARWAPASKAGDTLHGRSPSQQIGVLAIASRDPSGLRYRMSHGGASAVLELQRLCGNAAVGVLIKDNSAVRTAQRCGDHVDEDCASCSPVAVSRQVEQQVVQRQTASDPWAGPSPGGGAAATATKAASYQVVEDKVQVAASNELEALLGLPPETIPPGALSNPDFLLSLAANTPGASAAALQEMVGVPDEVAGSIPEDKVVAVDQHDLSGLPTEREEGSPSLAHEIHGGLHGADEAISHGLAHEGYNSAGPNAIGIVAFPQSRLVRVITSPSIESLKTPGPIFPESKIFLGHTAMYVRIDNKIQVIKSYAPESLIEATLNFGRVRSGKGGIPAQIIDHLGNPHPPGGQMFDIMSGRSVEYAVPKDMAIRFADSLPEGGPLPGELYTAQPEVAEQLGHNTRLCMGQNCVRWAVPKVEQFLGITVGRQGESVVNVGGVDRARQGKLMEYLKPDPNRPVEPVKISSGEKVTPTLGEMPTYLKVFKHGGRVYGVFSYGLSVYRIATAPAGHEAEVIFEELGGHGGGIIGARAGVGACLALAPETAGLSLLACGIFGGVLGSKVFGEIGGAVGNAIDAIINAPALVGEALSQAREVLGQFADVASSIARAPQEMLFQNLNERREELNVMNWDVRYVPETLQADLRLVGEALWIRIKGLNAQGLLDVADKPLREFGVPGDAVGRLARGVSDLARKSGQDYLVITADNLMSMPLFEFPRTMKTWNLTFVQAPAYISGSGGRYQNEVALKFHLYPLLRSRATIKPSNWDVDSIPAVTTKHGVEFDVPLDVERVGTTFWSRLSKLDEEAFKADYQRPLPDFGVPDELIERVAAGLSEESQFMAHSPEMLRQLTPEGFVDYLISNKTGFKLKIDPDHVAETSLRWVRAGFKPW